MVVQGRCCCFWCCDNCIEQDIIAGAGPGGSTQVQGKVTYKGFGGGIGWSQTPLTPPGSVPAGWPSSITDASQFEDLEATFGGFLCGRSSFVNRFDCMFRTLFDSLSGGDGLNLGMFYAAAWPGHDDALDTQEYGGEPVVYAYPLPECIAFVPGGTWTYGGVAVGSSSSWAQFSAELALVRSLAGDRYIVAHVGKGSGSGDFTWDWPVGCTGAGGLLPCAPRYMFSDWVGFVKLTEGKRITCDGLEVEIPLSLMSNTFSDLRYPTHGDITCQPSENVAGRPLQEAFTGPTSLLVNLYRV